MKSPSWNLSFSYAEKQMAAMTLGSVDGINKLDKKSGSNFWVCARDPKVLSFKWKL